MVNSGRRVPVTPGVMPGFDPETMEPGRLGELFRAMAWKDQQTYGRDTTDAFLEVWNELRRATAQFGPFSSAHEASAVIREEFEEFWDEVKASKAPDARERQRHEAVQLASMAVRFLVDCPPEEEV